MIVLQVVLTDFAGYQLPYMRLAIMPLFCY